MDLRSQIVLILIVLSFLATIAASGCVPSKLFQDLNSLEHNSTACPAVVKKWVEYSIENHFDEIHRRALRDLNWDVWRIEFLLKRLKPTDILYFDAGQYLTYHLCGNISEFKTKIQEIFENNSKKCEAEFVENTGEILWAILIKPFQNEHRFDKQVKKEEKKVARIDGNFASSSVRKDDISRLSILMTSMGVIFKEFQNPPKSSNITVTNNGGICDSAIIQGYFWAGLQPKNVLKAMKENSDFVVIFEKDENLNGIKIGINGLNNQGKSLKIVAHQAPEDKVGYLIQLNDHVLPKRVALQGKIIILFFKELISAEKNLKVLLSLFGLTPEDGIRDYIELKLNDKRLGLMMIMEPSNPEIDFNQVVAKIPEILMFWFLDFD